MILKWIIQKGHPLYHCGGQCVSVVFTIDRHWIFLREKYKDRLCNSKSQMISNLIFSFHPLHDVFHLVDVLTTNHHNIAWQRVFKCCESSLENSMYSSKQFIISFKMFMHLRNVIFCVVKSILYWGSFLLSSNSIFARKKKKSGGDFLSLVSLMN